jgi:stearoyl-CoA desaturase (delta-9 desaturase)
MTVCTGTSPADLPQQSVPPASDTPITSSLGTEPWKSPWWKIAKGDHVTFFYIVGIHILAAIGLVFFPTPGWRVMVATVCVAWLCALAITICYHRSLSHTALRLHPVVKHFLIFFAMVNGSSSPDTWIANHRQHHAKVETPEDISSPAVGGFWWAHLRWLWQSGNVPFERWCPDLNKPEYLFWRKLQIPIMSLSILGGLAFGIPAFFWLGPMRLVASFHGQCFINSIAHMRADRRPGDDSSQNIGWLAFVHFFQGENWHSNHHAKPSSARIGWKFWQIDFGWYVILMLEAVGLATAVKRPHRN